MVREADRTCESISWFFGTENPQGFMQIRTKRRHVSPGEISLSQIDWSLLSLYYGIVKLSQKKPDDLWLIAGGAVVLILAFMIGNRYASRTTQNKPDNKTASISAEFRPPSRPTLAMVRDLTQKENQLFYNLQRQWLFFESKKLGISFDYPVPAGEITFYYVDYTDRETDPTGQSYGWKIKIDDGSQYGYTYDFAGGISENFKAGREGWFTDFYEIQKSDYKGAKKLFKTKYETDAIWKDSKFIGMGETEPNPNDFGTLILVNLPIEKDPRFHGIAIYFRDPITEGDAQKVVESLTVE